MNNSSSSPQVFINFQGHKLRNHFISYLEKALRENEINFYIDMDSGRGEDINFVFKRIEESKIALTVFSKVYTESAWCLSELVKIMQQKEAGKLIVIPIYFIVTVEDVLKQMREFGFSLYGWEKAFQSVPTENGLSSANYKSESDFIADIVLAVKKVITQIEIYGLGPRVYISFRGVELRRTFVSYLVSVLQRHGVDVYIDTDLMQGEELINPFKRIEESKIALVIFSSRYTESPWCLSELVKIKELAEEGKLMALPIFYKLKPSDVKELKGDFGLNLEMNSRANFENVKKWKEALDFVSQNHGMVFHENSDEAEFLDDIVMRVKQLILYLVEKFEKPHSGLHYQQKDALKDATSKSFKGVEGSLWDAKSDVKSEEAKFIEDDGLNSRVDENFLGRTNSDATSKLQKSFENDGVDSVNEENKQEIISKSNTMVTYNERPSQHHVFINFQGDDHDLRYGFVSRLKNALKRDGVNVYNDVYEKMDDNLETRFKVLEVSTIALVILSERYTKSKWCLDELVKIMEQADERKLLVIPIFYKVEPSLVRDMEGSFGSEFRWLCIVHRGHNISKWKEALDYVTSKKGFVLDKYSDEVNFVTDLSSEVRKLIVQISLERTEKSQDQLSEQHKYATMDSSGLEGLKGMDGKRDGILLDTKPDRNLKGAEIVHAEEKSSRDDGLNLSKDDNFLGEANSENKRVDTVKEMASENSTTATYEKPLPQHQVFINFRGTDVRHSFVADLEKALIEDGVKVYNDKAEMDEDLGNLFNRIEESRIALVIFSSRYAESILCLNELVKIQELQEEGKLFVIPIFYKVDQSEVELLRGDFGVTFWNLWRIERDSHIVEWKEALKSVASMEGICLKDYISESEFITVTVRKVIEKVLLHEEESIEWPTRKEEKRETYLNKRFLFGMEQRMEKLEKKLEFDCKETRIIGVVGMHGIGKTTLAMMLHGKWNCKFIRCVALLGIRKKSGNYGLAWLRKTLLEVLREGKFPIISDEITHGTVQAELLKTKIFAVLDDVSDKQQLDFLLGNRGWLKKGSKIVITTCDKSLLEGYAHDTYVVPELDDREAFQLFSYLAFSDHISSPTGTFLTLCRKVVDYARGNPLALNLLGSELHAKDKDQWKYILETLTKKSNMLFQDVWRLSTDPLTENQKDVLLDIACFFKSEDEYIVRSLLDSGDPDSTNAVSEVKALANKFLITVAHGRVEMNVPLYRYPMDLCSTRWLRLWNYKDVINKLMKMEKSDADNVRGIFVNMSKLITNIYLDSSTFINMRNLRYLKIYDYSCHGQCEVNCKLCVLDGLELPLKEVRYLHWVRFPLEELPPDFSPQNLVDLRLPYSKIKRVWEGGKKTPRLKWVDLSHSSKLLNLSALSNAENLQRLNLEGCTSLDELPMEIQSMKSLVFLNLRGCIRLWSLPKVNLIALKTLILSGCIILEEFHLFSESLEVLRLDDTAIKELPPGIKNLQRLVVLNLKNCKMLNCLPNCLGELKALEELILSGCSRLKNLSDVRESMKHLQSLLLDRMGAKEMPNLSCVRISEGQASEDIALPTFGAREWPRGLIGVCSLRRLCLSGNDFVSLQTDIGKLYNLNWLDVKQCKLLTSIPMLPPRLQYFDAHGCDSLQRVANPLAVPVLSEQIHATFNFSNCNKLDQDAKDSIISYTRWKSQLVLDAIYQYNGGSVLDDYTGTCFPGREVPAWFSHQVSGSVLKSKLLPHWSDNRLTGIALCAVIILHGNFEQRNRLFLTCNCLFNNNDESLVRFGCTVGSWSKLSNTPGTIEPSHVFIGYTSMLDIRKHSEQADEGGCSHTESEASFEFQVTDGTKVIEDCEVLKCGFSFVYATDERENSRWYTENAVIPKRTDKIPGEERSYGNSGSDDGIQYESYSSLTPGRGEKFFSEEKSDATPNLQKRGYLSDEDQAYGQHELQGGRPSSSMEIINPLRSSIDQLSERQKDVFLDIVYFFKSEDEYFVRSLLDSRNHEAVSELTDLANKFLITISQGQIEMHDQLYTLGKDHPSPRWQRLWNYKEIIDKLTEMEQQEANNVRGIFLDISEITTNIALECMAFADMRNLLYLKIYDSFCPWQCTADYNLYLPDGLDFPLEEIRYLHWEKFPLEELPPDFRPENLVDLRLPYSKIERIWEGVKDTPWLKWVDLSHSSRLHDLSALSKADNLQRLNLEGCTSLDKLPEEIRTMKSLVFLNLRGCVRLRSLPKMNLISLKTLILSDCSNLKEFQLISDNVEILHLDGTSIKGLPPTIRDLHRLVVLNLKNCKMLECLPDCLGSLEVLDELILSGCSRLNNLPDIRHSLKHLQILLLDGTGAIEMPSISCFTGFEGPNPVDMFLQPFGSYSSVGDWPCGVNRVSSLRRLCLNGNDFVSLQPDISELYNLKWLDVQQCKKLRFVPLLPPRLQYFDAHGCESLERVANPLALAVLSEQIHATFNFSNCNNLDQDAKDNIMSYTRWRSQLVLDELTRYNGAVALEAWIGTCFPGWEVPAWFSHRASGSVVETKLPLHWCVHKSTGIALCAVIVFHGYDDQRKRVLVKCNCELKNEDGSSIHFSCTVGGWSEPSNAPRKIKLTHVFIGYTSKLDINFHVEEGVKEGCSHTEAYFKFQVTDGTEVVLQDCEVLKCGFSLLYETDELQAEPGVRGATVEANHYRAFSNNDGYNKTAERLPDGGCEIVELPNKILAPELATSPQPPITELPRSPEHGTRLKDIQASDVDALRFLCVNR